MKEKEIGRQCNTSSNTTITTNTSVNTTAITHAIIPPLLLLKNVPECIPVVKLTAQNFGEVQHCISPSGNRKFADCVCIIWYTREQAACFFHDLHRTHLFLHRSENPTWRYEQLGFPCALVRNNLYAWNSQHKWLVFKLTVDPTSSVSWIARRSAVESLEMAPHQIRRQ